MKKWIVTIVAVALSVGMGRGEVPADSIYQGTQIKIDIASPVIVAAANKWQMQNYEAAVNVRLANRFYPTLEAGYAFGTMTRDSISYTDGTDKTSKLGGNYAGQGGFIRIGCDINPLKKHPESPHALLIGVRLATGVQGFSQSYNHSAPFCHTVKADCWGELVAGCQVEVAKVKSTAFYMGWMGRFKCLFTRMEKEMADPWTALETAWYIPGYGKRDNIGWGLNYYLGWRF